MTMKKLADIADVSVSTVYKAFSGRREISEEKSDCCCLHGIPKWVLF